MLDDDPLLVAIKFVFEVRFEESERFLPGFAKPVVHVEIFGLGWTIGTEKKVKFSSRVCTTSRSVWTGPGLLGEQFRSRRRISARETGCGCKRERSSVPCYDRHAPEKQRAAIYTRRITVGAP